MHAMSAAGDDSHPQTCCSNCQTVFEVTAELLESSDTRVRCGECLSIFDALLNLKKEDQFNEDDDFLVDSDGNIIEPETYEPDATDADVSLAELVDVKAGTDHYKQSELPDAGAAALAGLNNDTGPLDVTYADFNLFSEDAGLPEVAFFDHTQEPAAYGYDDEEDEDESGVDTRLAQDLTGELPDQLKKAETGQVAAVVLNKEVDFVTSDSKRDPIVFKYREKEPVTETGDNHSPAAEIGTMTDKVRNGLPNAPAAVAEVLDARSPWILRSSLAALALMLMAGLYAIKERESLFNSAPFRPVLAGLCSFLPCDGPVSVDIEAFRTVKRAAFSHPNIENALIIDLAFINEATFSQPHPVLELKLTDITGRLVVMNKFAPSDYLDNWQVGDQLDSGERQNVSLTVEDPGRDVTSFVVGFH